ncbi:Trs120-domain-containing protein [Sodiomyces alkalinus F11]|uniref:Trs120-domain-containing protein n=1 Tax=Sodiomyces alkalinus (strain CBS 110278 / VKM F-3762 / F11) TaxID=1314773 RepID=A0A3N2PXA8_SODAK|nr:Trs120-domain-containing protein [Sodiomyces alkalinus F11]ROT39108.1 Trs120-domain-containing protein [Sodiomyces alkalinus F11]
MSSDPLLPIAPARVRALALPVGRIKTERFASFVERLREEHVVYLRDVSPDGRPNRNMFSPLAFPDGAMFYDVVTHLPPPSHLALSPFDLYREPLAVIAIADGAELDRGVFNKRNSPMAPTTFEQNIRALYQDLEDLRDGYAKALVHNVVIFDYMPSTEQPLPLPEGIMTIPPPEHCKRTTMKTVMCDVSSLLLAEMTTLAKSFEAMTVIESPGYASSARPTNGSAWGGDESASAMRRNSQYSLPSNPQRSNSTSGLPDRSQARMSMPPVPSKGSPLPSSSSTPLRPSTPVRSGLSNPPTTFDEISGGSFSNPPSPEQKGGPRPGSGEYAGKAAIQDRVSVQGFGPGGLNERWRNKGRGRVLVILGSLYLQAGRWSDALKELSDGATVARSINDHIWHGKALELIVVSLLLLGWAKIEFQIPTVCLPQDKASTAILAAQEAAVPEDPLQPKHLRRLQLALPDLLDRIVGLYSRLTAEHLPPLPMAEVTIRCCKLMSALHLADGKLGDRAFETMVLGRLPTQSLTTSPRLTINPSRQQIVTLLFRAFPSSASELLTIVDRATILAGIASVLGPLGHQRKKAMVIRELVSVLISGLVEARTRGAADVGIHPAAGLVALNAAIGRGNGSLALELGEGDVEQGVDAFLGMLCKSYGVVGFDMARKLAQKSPPEDGDQGDDSNQAVIARIEGQSAARFFGFTGVKLNILRACINFSEALPDFNGVLKYSSDLLRSAGSGIAPGPRREDASPCIAREEQVRLATNISRTFSLANRLGLHHLVAEYWDEFLVRGVTLVARPSTRVPVPHAKAILPGASGARTSQDVDPFIYNPFLKKPDDAVVEHILVANEPATFKVTLQNPFDIEVEIESIRLDAQGVEFESYAQALVLGPYRTQVVKLVGVPKQVGALTITGAVVRVHGCRERSFPIFQQPFTPKNEAKVKAIGLGALEENVSTALSREPLLTAEKIGLTVISQQPVVVVKSTTLPQSSMMVLEGERQLFSTTLENLSTTVAADFMLFSFEDSTQSPLQAAINNREASPAELYEYEYILMKRPALRKVTKNSAEKRYIAPGRTATFDFEILGKPGLTKATLQVDYAHLGVPPDEVVDKFHTRRVSLDLTVTVNASVEVARFDVLPLHGVIPRNVWAMAGCEGGSQKEASPEDYCLLTMDLRNAWPSQMQVRIEGEDGVAIQEHILPGNTTRVMVPVRRLHLEDPHASIPALNPSRQRQFVVSSSKISPDMERANREAFWFREKLLDNLSAKWETVSGPKRAGFVELRMIRLIPRMLEALKVEEVGIDISVASQAAQASEVYVDEFVPLKVRVTNRTNRPIYPMLRLMPALCHRPLNVALDFTRKLGWNGTLQQPLPLLDARSSTDVELCITTLCRGEFEITASVEEIQVWEEQPKKEEKEESGRPRSDTQTMLEAALGTKERRVWHSRQPCIITVKDRP